MMAIYRSLNNVSDTGNAVPWYIKETLKDAGWVVGPAGTGTSGIDDVGDPFLYFGSGAAGVITVPHYVDTLGRPYCWFVATAPNGKQLFFQRAAGSENQDGAWLIGCSPGGLYTGVYDEVTPQTATDEIILFNVRPVDADPYIFQYGLGDNVVHVVANSTPVNGEYGFRAIEITATNNCNAFLFFDTLEQVPAGQFSPLVIGCINGGIYNTYLAKESGTTDTKTFMLREADYGGGVETFVGIPGYGYARAFSVRHDTNGKVSLYDGKERPLPYPVYEWNGGFIGVSTGLAQAAVNRDYPSLDTETETHLYVDQVMLLDFWDGTSTPTEL